jgi:acetyl esterase/lipase
MSHSLPSSLAAFLLVAPCTAQAVIEKQTFTYKTVQKLAIKADVYRARDKTVRPVVVWIHGGALINGHRGSVNRRLKNAFLEAGFIVLSCDYRLAPETRLPEIIADIQDLFRWIAEKGPTLFHADPKRIAVCGGSAGGYLTLVTGYRVKPRPLALVSFWGYGDLIGPWYSEPSAHPRHHRVELSREKAFAQVSGPPIADARDRKGNGGWFYQFCRQRGIWPKAVSGWDPHTEGDKFRPYMPVANVTADYPPTLMIHGTKDTDVPYGQSVMMRTELQKHRTDHKLVSVENGEHGLAGADRKRIDAAYTEAIRFVCDRLGPPAPTGTDETRLSTWKRGVAITSSRDPELRMHLWFYEWNMFGAVTEGQHTRGTFESEIRLARDGTSATVLSRNPGIELQITATPEGADLTLSVTNKSGHDWPALAAVIPCFNPGPKPIRNAAFANTKTWFLSASGLELVAMKAPREIHFQRSLREVVESKVDGKGRYAWSHKWPKSAVDATAGLIIRESTSGKLVTGIVWDRFLSVQAHNPWQCMHLSVHVGPLARGQTRKVRGKIYLLKGTRGDVLARYRRDFVKRPK